MKIKYNDEFNNDFNLEDRLEGYIKKYFYPAYTISTLAPIYLIGGAIRDLMNARCPKDLDFVVVGKQNLEWVMDVFNGFEIEYIFNRFGGYKFNYNGTEIDLWLTNDLFSAMEYNVDGLLFDVKNNSLLSLTFDDFIDNGLRKINNDNNIENGRIKKLIKFEKEFKK